jgi:Zn-dependent proteases
MAFNSIQSGRFDNPGEWLLDMLMRMPAIIIGITFHEAAHAYSAWKLGDQTPMAQKRVTLNPLRHLDPIGLIALVFVGFGWGKPVQVNPYAFKKNPRLSNLIVDVAGVITNFIIAFLFTALLFVVKDPTLFTIVLNIVYINIVLMLFNLLPVPPLDGFGIVTEVFGLRRFSWYHKLYSFGTFILLAIVIFGVAGKILGPALNEILSFFYSVWSPVFL